MSSKELAAELKKHAEYLRQTPIPQPLKAVETINHLLTCVGSLDRLAEKLEAEEEEKANENHHEPETGI